MILKMAYLNIWRRRSRSFVVVIMIAVSVVGLLLMQGIYEGMMNQMVENTTRSDSAQISIYGSGYRLSKSLNDSIKSPQEIQKYLTSRDEVKSFIVRIKAEGLVATSKHSQGTLLIGTKLENEDSHASLSRYIVDGKYEFGEKSRGVLLGYKLAKKLKIKVGKKIIITTQDKNKELTSLSLRVKGVVKTNDAQIDKMAIIMDFDKLKKMLQLDKQASQISINLHSKNFIDDFEKTLKNDLQKQDIEVFSWKKLFPIFNQMDDMMLVFNLISYGLVFIVASIGIFGVVLVSVLERVREFGIMLAIGNSFRDIKKLIVLESMVLGLFGFVIGATVGGLVLAYLSIYGLDLSVYSDGLSSFGMGAIMYANIEVIYFIQALISVTLATFFAALWPIIVLKKLHPIEAINK